MAGRLSTHEPLPEDVRQKVRREVDSHVDVYVLEDPWHDEMIVKLDASWWWRIWPGRVCEAIDAARHAVADLPIGRRVRVEWHR